MGLEALGEAAGSPAAPCSVLVHSPSMSQPSTVRQKGQGLETEPQQTAQPGVALTCMGLANMLVSTSFLASEYLSAPNVSFKLFWRRKEREYSVLASCGDRGTQADLTGANSSSSEPNSSFPRKSPCKPKSAHEIGFCFGASSPNRTAHTVLSVDPPPSVNGREHPGHGDHWLCPQMCSMQECP